MAEGKVTVLALIRAAAGKEEELYEELKKLVGPSRGDDGCINYDLHRSLEDSARFMFHENWASRQHLEDHLQQPHLQRFMERADSLLAEPVDITTWSEVDGG